MVAMGMAIDPDNPPASVFRNAAGDIGHRLFGLVMWSAAITSVIGAAFTSVSFFKTFDKRLEDNSRLLIIGFILVSAAILIAYGRPISVLVWAGTINGFILPIGLAIVLIASRQSRLMGDYRHPAWLQAAGWVVVAVMAAFSAATVWSMF
jgi:Mn2+/Fe2+ NRAMP family transporter